MILGFLVTVAFLPGFISSAVVLRWTVLLVGMPLMLAAAPGRLWLSTYTPLWLLGLGFATNSLLWTPDPFIGVNNLVHLVVLFGAFTLGATTGPQAVIKGVAVGLIFSALIAGLQVAGWTGIEQAHFDSVPGGLFYNRNVLAELAAPVAVWCLLRGRWALLVAPGACLMLAVDRAALLGLAAAFLVALRGWHRVMAILMCAITLGALSATTHAVASSVERVAMLLDVLNLFNLTGLGLGAYTTLFPYAEHLHNDPLQLLLELGFGAAFLLTPFCCAAFRRTVGAEPERMALVVLFVESLVSFPFQLPASGFLASVLAGALCAAGSRVYEPTAGGRVSAVLGVPRYNLAHGHADGNASSGGGVPVRPAFASSVRVDRSSTFEGQ